jgi:bile acid:Na+ symporter, BASS family
MDTAVLVKLLNVVALITMMLSIGLSVKYEQVLASARQTRLVLLALVANFVLVPLVTLGLLFGFHALPLVSAGFLILAVCPGAPVGPTLTAIAKGNVAVATGLMVLLAGLSAVLSPALLSVLLAQIAPEGNLHTNYLGIVETLLITQLLPLGLGLGLHHWAPRFSQGIVKQIGILANFLLLALVGLIVTVQHETLVVIRVRGWLGMGLLLLASLGIGWVCGGSDLATRKAMATTTATRNVAVGLVIATSDFAGTPAVTAVVAYGLVSIVGALGCALLFGKLAAVESKNAHVAS